MSIHVGSLRTEGAINSVIKKAWGGISSVASTLNLPNIGTVGRGFLTIFTERGIMETTLGMKNTSVGLSNHSHAGNTQQISAGRLVSVDSGRAIGMRAETSFSVTSAGEIHITCGKSGILLNRNGNVQIAGVNLFLDFEGNIEANSEGKISVDGKEVEQKADNGFIIKGGRVDIN